MVCVVRMPISQGTKTSAKLIASGSGVRYNRILQKQRAGGRRSYLDSSLEILLFINIKHVLRYRH